MIALQNDNIGGAYLQLTTFIYTFSCREVVFGKFYLLATQDGIHLLVEEFYIHCSDTLEVVLAILVLWCINTIYEIIIRTDCIRTQSTSHHQDGQSLGSRGLSTTAGASDKHQTGFSAGNIIGYIGKLLGLQCLADIYQIGCTACLDSLIKIAYSTHTQDILPLVMLAYHTQHLLLFYEILQGRGVFFAGNAQEQTIVERHQGKEVQHTRTGQQRTIEIVDGIF